MRIGTYNLEFNEPIRDGNFYKGELPYRAPRNGGFNAVLFSNGRLNALSGDARIQPGVKAAAIACVTPDNGEHNLRWSLQENCVLGFEEVYERIWENEVEIIAQIKCVALDKQTSMVRINPL